MDAIDYNKAEFAADRLTWKHITELGRQFQASKGLEADGRIGPATRAALIPPTAPLVFERVWPLRCLANGRKPEITSGHYSHNPARPNHRGVDLFFRHLADDPPNVRRGDGAGAGQDPDGTVKWWIPANTLFIASAAGEVVIAGKSPTGFRLWISVAGGAFYNGYFHGTKLFVSAGDVVEVGQPLGIVGDNPLDIDASHLHFEKYVGDLDHYMSNKAGSLDPTNDLKHAAYLPAI